MARAPDALTARDTQIRTILTGCVRLGAAYDSGAEGRLAVFWHHGTPYIGAPPESLFEAADRLGLRWVSRAG